MPTCPIIAGPVTYVVSCQLEILNAHIAIGVAEGRLWEVSFTDLAILLGITTEVLRPNMLQLSLCLMTYYSGPSIIWHYLN